MLKNMIRQLFTETDNETQDIARWLAAIAIVCGLGLQIFAVGWHGQPFDMQQFGVGTGALFTGLGVALKFKPESPKLPRSSPSYSPRRALPSSEPPTNCAACCGWRIVESAKSAKTC